MASYVKFELEDGTVVFIESADVPKGSSGFPLTTRGETPHEQESVSFTQSIQSVRKMASVLVQELRGGFTELPDEVQVNFGLKASAEIGGLVVARGGVESNYNVMLRWGKEKPEARAARSGKAAEKASAETAEDEKE